MENTAKAKRIKMVIFDVDGVLTDGRIYLSNEKIETKAFNTPDGLGIQLLQKSGIEIGVISARQSNAMTTRMQSLKVKYIYQGNQNKLEAFSDLLKKTKLKTKEICYVGDDLPDLPILQRAGLSIAPANAHEFVKEHVDFVTHKSGGMGAVREICDFILKSQGTFDLIYRSYLKK